MRRGLVVSLALTAIVLAAFVPAPRVAGDLLPPVFHETSWTPRWPIHPSNVTLYANVSDADGVASVGYFLCYFTDGPPGTCLPGSMTYTGVDGIWNATPAGPGGHTTQAFPVLGAHVNLTATDAVGNNAWEDFWILFVDSLNLTLTPDALGAYPSAAATVNGTAYYEGNASAPAEGVVVTVTIEGANAPATVDANGGFTATLTAPAAEGTYPVTATATDRTLPQSTADGTLTVSAVPRPELLVENARVKNASPTAGEPCTVAFDVRNIGSADAPDTRILVEVSRGGAWTTILDERATLAKGGGTATRNATWTPEAGTYSVRIRVDPDDEFGELNETNNVRTLTVSVAAAGIPLWVVLTGGFAVVAAVGAAWGLVRLRRRREEPPIERGKAL